MMSSPATTRSPLGTDSDASTPATLEPSQISVSSADDDWAFLDAPSNRSRQNTVAATAATTSAPSRSPSGPIISSTRLTTSGTPAALSVKSPVLSSASRSPASSFASPTSPPASFSLSAAVSGSSSSSSSQDSKSIYTSTSPDVDLEGDEDEDDDGIDEELSKPEKSKGFSLTMKKFWASRTAQSRVGRSLIVAAIGPEGTRCLQAVKDAVERFAGAKKAKQIRTLIIRMAVKVKLIQDENLLTPRQIASLTEPINQLAIHFLLAIRPRPNIYYKEKEPNGDVEECKLTPIDYTALSKEFQQLKEHIASILMPHMKPENLKLLREGFEFLGSQEFLMALGGQGQQYQQERYFIYSALQRIVAGLIQDRPLDPQLQAQWNINPLCEIQDCEEFALESDGEFRGCKKCLLHHEEAFQAFLAKPTVMHFLTGDGRDYAPFQRALREKTQKNLRRLWLALQQFTACKPAVRAVFADEIYKKYLKSGASHPVTIPKKDLEYIETLLEAKEFIHCYDDLKLDVYKEISKFFETVFMKGQLFSGYVSAYRLPAFLGKECIKKREEKKKEQKKREKEEKELAKK